MRHLLLFFLLFFTLTLRSQEFMISVSVNAQQLEGTDIQIFQNLQTSINEFINSRNWTNYNFKPDERIEGTIMITLSERLGSDEYKGRMNLILRRPVYRTNYNCIILNHVDRDLHIRYIDQQPLDYSDGSFTSNLTSLMAFYAYIFLGFDADSYSKFGGTPYYEKAMGVVSTAQNAIEKGWKAYESQRNRYWLIENLLNGAYSPLRESIYLYHRRGLDVMTENMELGRLAISESLEMMRQANRQRPGLYLMQLLLEAKRDEIVNIYSQANDMDKPRIVGILKEIDPANSSTYQRIMTPQNL
ncbi:MAG: DUF4835 family protein [Bacteroidales bacterium]|nr:DUF4835 family protein [Bacteroidales bacterium]MDZ4203928.1 DUF4835 family protein [Bacteroidales bacterium]